MATPTKTFNITGASKFIGADTREGLMSERNGVLTAVDLIKIIVDGFDSGTLASINDKDIVDLDAIIDLCEENCRWTPLMHEGDIDYRVRPKDTLTEVEHMQSLPGDWELYVTDGIVEDTLLICIADIGTYVVHGDHQVLPNDCLNFNGIEVVALQSFTLSELARYSYGQGSIGQALDMFEMDRKLVVVRNHKTIDVSRHADRGITKGSDLLYVR